MFELPDLVYHGLWQIEDREQPFLLYIRLHRWNSMETNVWWWQLQFNPQFNIWQVEIYLHFKLKSFSSYILKCQKNLKIPSNFNFLLEFSLNYVYNFGWNWFSKNFRSESNFLISILFSQWLKPCKIEDRKCWLDWGK